MRKSDNAKLDALGRAIDTLRINQELFKNFKPLKDRYTELVNRVQALQATRTQLTYSSTGITAEKTDQYNMLANQTVAVAKVGCVWAKSQQDRILTEILDIELSDFSRIAEAEAIAMAERVEESLRPHLQDLEEYNITAAKLDKIKQSLLYFKSLQLKPRQHIGQNKVQNKQFAADIKAAMELAQDIENLVVGEYGDSQTLFVNQLFASMRIYDPATRSTALKLVILDKAGKPIHDATCDLVELEGEEQNTNSAGYAEIAGIRSGSYTLEVRKEGYQAQRTTIAIVRGQKLTLNLQLSQNS